MENEMPAPAHAAPTQTVDPVERLIQEGAYRDAAGLCAREYGAVLGRLCMALLGAQAEAEEAVQETLLAAHSGMAQYRAEGSVKSWLYGIARRTCARRLETRIRRERRLVLVHDAEADAKLPDELLDARRDAEHVRAALERLKPTERDALLLRYESGLSYREIGLACGLDEATARKRASRALEKLGALLAQKEGTR
jgi:RNA polymerase sigma-70 factor (ECF subfamily)